MRIQKVLFAASVAALVSSAPYPADAVAPTFFAKKGATVDDRDKVVGQCHTTVEAQEKVVFGGQTAAKPEAKPLQLNPGTNGPGYKPPAADGAVVGNVIVAAFRLEQWRKVVLAQCMRRSGYIQPNLTRAELDSYKRLKGAPEREKWEREFFSSPRYPEATTPLVPQFDEVEPDPMILDAVRIVPGSLVLQAGPFREGDIVLKGKARLLGKATIVEAFTQEKRKVAVSAGQTFYQSARFDLLSGEWVSGWCGIGRSMKPKGGAAPICLNSNFESYGWLEPVGQNGSHIFFVWGPVESWGVVKTPLTLSPLDVGGPIDIEFRLSSIETGGFAAVAKIDGETKSVGAVDFPEPRKNSLIWVGDLELRVFTKKMLKDHILEVELVSQ